MKKLKENIEKSLLFVSYMIAVSLVLFIGLLIMAGVNYVADALFN